jgi:hypothetical protein
LASGPGGDGEWSDNYRFRTGDPSDVNEQSILNTVSVYPNPFSEKTNILFNLNYSEKINISIYNALGNMVLTSEAEIHSGSQAVEFSGAGLPSGIYYYRITGSTFNHSGTLQIVR